MGLRDDRLLLTNFMMDSVRCLDVYPLEEWLRFEEAMKQKPRFDRRLQLFQNYYLSGAHECQVDRQGRILIPPLLRDYAGLQKDVVFAAAGEKFHIWDREAWKKVFTAAEETLQNNPDFFNDLNI